MSQVNDDSFYSNEPSIESIFICPRNESPPWCLSEYQTTFCVDPICLRAAERHPHNLIYSSIGDLKLPYDIILCPETLWAKYNYAPEDIIARLNEICEPVELEAGFFFFHWGEICVKSTIDGQYIESILPYYSQMIRPHRPGQTRL